MVSFAALSGNFADVRATFTNSLRTRNSFSVTLSHFRVPALDTALRLQREHRLGWPPPYTPCRIKCTEPQAAAFAIVHAELIMIHPFRDGNGRCARLLAMLMGLQAGLPALDFGGIRGAKKRRYIAAVHSALDHNYAPMTEIFRDVIARTLKSAARTS